MDGRNMGQNDPAGDGAEAERPSGEASSVTMEEFEEMLRRIITAPPKTYEEVKLGKRRRRDGAIKGNVKLREPLTKRARPRTRRAPADAYPRGKRVIGAPAAMVQAPAVRRHSARCR